MAVSESQSIISNTNPASDSVYDVGEKEYSKALFMSQWSYVYEDPRIAEKLELLKRNRDMHTKCTKHEFKMQYVYKMDLLGLSERQYNLLQKMAILQEKRVKQLESNLNKLFGGDDESDKSKKNIATEIINLEKTLCWLHKERINNETGRQEIYRKLEELKISDPNNEYDNTLEERSIVYKLEQLDIKESILIENERITREEIDVNVELLKDVDLYQCDAQSELDIKHMDIFREQRNLNKEKRNIQHEIYSDWDAIYS